MTMFVCSSCNCTISGSRLVEREPMCRACLDARATAARRPPLTAVIFAPVLAATLAGLCLTHGLRSPFDGINGFANLAFWVVGGMAVGLIVRVAVKSS
jgi:hypothetical protein